MRKLWAILLAVPVLVVIYAAVLGRAGLARVGSGVAAAALIALVVLAGMPPAQSNAVPVSDTPDPVEARVLDAVATGHGLTQPITVSFDAPMDPSTVAAALRLEPDTAVSFAWDTAGRALRVSPLGQWKPGTLYVLTVSTAARAVDGGALRKAVRSTILTAAAGTGRISATRETGGRARLDTAFRITLDRPVTLAAVKAALRIEPAIDGVVTAGDASGTFLFTPAKPLAVDATYALSLPGLVDRDGAAFGAVPAVTVQTVEAPEVVRFRPRDGDEKVDRDAAVSVRFTTRMDREKTAAAFSVSVGGTRLKGSVSWAEQGRVLVFVPAEPLPYGAKVVARVGDGAVSRAGTAVGESASGTFTVEPKPKATPKKAAAPAAKPSSKPKSKPISKSGGGGAVKGNWTGVEAYYLRLMNCTRTGGWVTSTGNCSSPGGRSVAALTLNSGISAKVSRPYAKLLATRNICNHFIGGTPGDRLRRAGYTSYRWGENLGCRSGNPYSAVLGSHRYFQSEKPYNGGHYRNLMDARFRQAGIGVWVSGGRVRLVVDFYTP